MKDIAIHDHRKVVKPFDGPAGDIVSAARAIERPEPPTKYRD
jgi:hypothetical protein